MRNNDDDDVLRELVEAWARESERIDRVAKEHPIAAVVPPRGLRSWTRHRRLMAVSVGCVALCAAALVWLVHIYDSSVEDVLDLVPHVVVGCTLLYGAVCSVRMAVLLRRHDPASTPPFEMLRFVDEELLPYGAPRGRHVSPFNFQAVKASALVGVVAIFLVATSTTYEGRSMSASCRIDRTTAMVNTNLIMTSINNMAAV